MNTVSSSNSCPRCGAAIPSEAPDGLCPRCVLLGAATPSESGSLSRLGEPPTLEAVQTAFPQLEIEGLIGRGGMGFVYRARQPQLDRTVALKLLPVPMGADPTFAERFAREGRLLARLNHPNIVSVFDFGQAAGFAFLLLEFVDGVNLRQAMLAGRFSAREALAIVPKVCDALQFAHEHGVLHRDIKPENILLDAAGRVKIADFGIAKLVGERAGDVTLTASGARLGTPHYMAPEQVEKPSEVDHRADIYSLGVVFYELLTGELPLGRFSAPSAKADLDARVDAIVMRALAKERELRQQSAGQVKTEVEGLGTPAEGTPPPAAAPMPAWGRRIAWLSLAYVVLGFAAHALSLGGSEHLALLSRSEGSVPVRLFVWPMELLLLPAAVALLTRRSGWRTAGLVGSSFALAVQLFAAVSSLIWLTRPPVSSLRVPVLTPLLMLSTGLGILVTGAVLWTLRHPDIRNAFGLSRRSSKDPKANPWPHRLFCLLVALVALPASAVVAALLGPIMRRASGGLGGITAGLIPMAIGALLVWMFVRTRPTAAQAQPREQWNPWPKCFFVAVIALVVVPVSLVFVGLLVPYLLWHAAVLPPLPTPMASGELQLKGVVAEWPAQLVPTERLVSDSQLRLRWNLRSRQPAMVRLSIGANIQELELQPDRSGAGYSLPVNVLFNPQEDGVALQMMAFSGDAPGEAVLRAHLPGRPAELLIKANELVAGELPLKFNTPVWIAFAGLEQVRLEVVPDATAPRPVTPPSNAPSMEPPDARSTLPQ